MRREATSPDDEDAEEEEEPEEVAEENDEDNKEEEEEEEAAEEEEDARVRVAEPAAAPGPEAEIGIGAALEERGEPAAAEHEDDEQELEQISSRIGDCSSNEDGFFTFFFVFDFVSSAPSLSFCGVDEIEDKE